MRLEILNSGYRLGTNVLFALVRVVTRRPLPDAAKLVFYRPDFYGRRSKNSTHEAMRGPSEWSVGDRELVAAFVSKLNDSEFCIGAHTATATQACGDQARVAAVLADLENAPVEEPLRATLWLLGKLTREHKVTADDVRKVLAAEASHQQIADALAVCCAFNLTNRLADAFGFSVPDSRGFAAGARYLLARGYR